MNVPSSGGSAPVSLMSLPGAVPAVFESLLQRMQTGNRHPVAPVIGLVLGAPLLHLLEVIGGQRVGLFRGRRLAARGGKSDYEDETTTR